MNEDMLRLVAATIEVEPERFHMDTWLHATRDNLCGTAGCVAGTAAVLDKEWEATHRRSFDDGEIYYFFDEDRLPVEAARILGIPSTQEWYKLFIDGDWWAQACEHLGVAVPDDACYGSLQWITAKHAATVLYALADGTITINQFPGEEADDDADYIELPR